jgi:hypothetical protein
MSEIYNWESPSSRLVLSAVLDTLAELGLEGLTATEVKARAGSAGPALGDAPDLHLLICVALEHVQLFSTPEPTGDLRQDLRRLLDPWRAPPSRDERIVAAVLSAALWRPRLRVALYEALDRPLTHTVAAMVARASEADRIPPRLIQTLCWVLRGLSIDRLRSRPRAPVDIDLLVDFLVGGLGLESVDSRRTAAAPGAATTSPA